MGAKDSRCWIRKYSQQNRHLGGAKKTDLRETATETRLQNTPVCSLTCRLMKLEVVSEDVLPSERLKRLLRLGNFLGSCEHQEDTF